MSHSDTSQSEIVETSCVYSTEPVDFLFLKYFHTSLLVEEITLQYNVPNFCIIINYIHDDRISLGVRIN